MTGVAREAEAAFPGANGRIVFESDRTSGKGVNNPTGDVEIFAMNRDGTGVTQLTKNTADDFDPSYSAKGDAILFSTNRDGNIEIYVMDSDGTDQIRLTDNTVTDITPTIAPDGTISQGDIPIGRLGLVRFDDRAVLSKEGDSRFLADGGEPQAAPDAKLRQGMLESSNSQPILEIVKLIELSRTYERVSKMMDNNQDLSKRAVERLGRSS